MNKTLQTIQSLIQEICERPDGLKATNALTRLLIIIAVIWALQATVVIAQYLSGTEVQQSCDLEEK